jgi:hypothetical protein
VLGGMIFALMDIRLFIVINGASFIFSAVCEMFIDFSLGSERVPTYNTGRISFLADIKEGFEYLIGRKEIIQLFLILVSLNFSIGFSVTVPLPYIINSALELSPKAYGLIQSAFPAGMIIGAVFVGGICKKVMYIRLVRRLGLALSICILAIALPVFPAFIKLDYMGYSIYYSVIMMVLGIIISFIDIPVAYAVQSMVPDEYRGRVLSIGISIGKIILPVAVVVSGLLLSLIPVYILPALGGILLLLLNIRGFRINCCKDGLTS